MEMRSRKIKGEKTLELNDWITWLRTQTVCRHVDRHNTQLSRTKGCGTWVAGQGARYVLPSWTAVKSRLWGHRFPAPVAAPAEPVAAAPARPLAEPPRTRLPVTRHPAGSVSHSPDPHLLNTPLQTGTVLYMHLAVLLVTPSASK